MPRLLVFLIPTMPTRPPPRPPLLERELPENIPDTPCTPPLLPRLLLLLQLLLPIAQYMKWPFLQYKIIIFQGQFTIPSAFSLETQGEKRPFNVQYAVMLLLDLRRLSPSPTTPEAEPLSRPAELLALPRRLSCWRSRGGRLSWPNALTVYGCCCFGGDMARDADELESRGHGRAAVTGCGRGAAAAAAGPLTAAVTVNLRGAVNAGLRDTPPPLPCPPAARGASSVSLAALTICKNHHFKY